MGKIDFPVIGIGASAGGLKVLQQFFDHLDGGNGMAYVVITHLAPEKSSAMDELLASHTPMDVEQVRGETQIKPNHIYIIPPKKQLTLKGNKLLLTEKVEGRQAVVDVFFRSMAKACEKMAIGIVLSGTGSDGTLGVKAIKEHGGVTMAQDPEEAQYDGMSRSAIETNMVDFIMPVNELARKVIGHKKILGEVSSLREEDLSEEENSALQKIFSLLASKKGHDFKHYKRSSVLRRLQRRLFVTNSKSISEYQRYLEENPVEITELFNDLLISVTNFFRDPEAFKALEKKVIPKLFENKNSEEPIRIWITGCATGEEVYSLAILLQEYAVNLDYMPQIKIFGTDISDEALRTARRGVYPEAIATDISNKRLQRYFHKEGSSYRVNKEIREKVLISNHDILADPPFLKQDLVACRNLLIYFNHDLQKEVLKILHYSLRPGGFLFLGMADSTIGATDLFAPINKSQGIYRSRQVPTSQKDIPRFPLLPDLRRSRPVGGGNNADKKNLTFDKVHYSLLANQYAPPSLIIDENNQVVHSSKGVDEYLSYAEGEPTRNVLKMISPQIQRSLRNIIFQYTQLEKPRLVSKKLKVEQENESYTLNLSIRPIEVSGFPQGFRQVTFEKIDDELGTQTVQKKLDENREVVESEIVEQLEEELKQTKEHLQQTIEEYETSNEELMASNEELQSMNEELQTTTEELETSKEELQSVNEELRTVNQELENKIDELKQANDDLKNLMEATEIGIVFLDKQLKTRLYTSNATELFNLIDSDVGRPLSDVTHKLQYDNLISDLKEMLADSKSIQKQVSTRNGDWYIMQIKPYKTTEYDVEGAVLTFVDITNLKKMETELKTAYKKLEAKVETEKQLQREILDVEKKERWRLGKYLHDGTAQNLLGIKMLLDIIDPKLQKLDVEAKTEIEKIKRLIIKTEANIRELSHFVLPIEIEGKVSKAFQQLAEQTEELYDIECKIKADGVIDLKDPASASSIYYITQEAIRNAIQHGQANKVEVRLSADDDFLVLIIRDNGIGYNKSNEGKGRGINIMKHRAELLGGSLKIKKSQKDVGTIVECTIPLKRNE